MPVMASGEQGQASPQKYDLQVINHGRISSYGFPFLLSRKAMEMLTNMGINCRGACLRKRIQSREPKAASSDKVALACHLKQ